MGNAMKANREMLARNLDINRIALEPTPRPIVDFDEVSDGIPDLATRNDLTHEFNKENVRKALRRADSNGATPSEIASLTGLTVQTARKCLDELCATREAYKLKRNRNITIYYNNGKPRHDFGVERIEDGNTTLEVSLAEGPSESLLLHVTEKRFTLLEGEQVEGGIIVPLNQIPPLIESMRRFHELAGGETEWSRKRT
ncbi:MAG TPA: hypothetical protein VGB78_08440 [Thermoplasmata archaeon]|jgi:hypothetical protein